MPATFVPERLTFIRIIILLLPLLLVYILVCIVTMTPDLDYGDEGRYALDVKNILSQKPLTLTQAPGYPLFLVIPRAAGLSWYGLKWFNPFLLFAAVVLAAKSLAVLKFSRKHVCLCAYALGFYVPFWNEMRYLLTEPLALAMISSAMYGCIRLAKTNSKRYFIVAAASLTALALIKAIMGYVIVIMCIIGYVISFFSRKEAVHNMRKLSVVFGLAFLLCIPYLIYTYHLTGKVFYWANTGGENVYWLTNPVAGEYGFWNPDERVLRDDQMAHHREFIESLSKDDLFKRDEAFMAAALKNIRQHPGKFIYNWLCNIARMFFNFPYDYKYQNPATLLYTVPNSLVFWLAVSMPVMLYKTRTTTYFEPIIILLVFMWAYWFVQSLSTAGPRKMYLVIPVFVVCFAYVVRTFCAEKKQCSSAAIAINTPD